MTCAQCGCTIGWDCACDPEYNAFVDDAPRREDDDQRRERPNLAREFNDLMDGLGLGGPRLREPDA